MTIYTTIGEVRGACGHKHHTMRAAQRCADRDGAACAKGGGYSDRAVCRLVDGVGARLTSTEAEELYDLTPESEADDLE